MLPSCTRSSQLRLLDKDAYLNGYDMAKKIPIHDVDLVRGCIESEQNEEQRVMAGECEGESTNHTNVGILSRRHFFQPIGVRLSSGTEDTVSLSCLCSQNEKYCFPSVNCDYMETRTVSDKSRLTPANTCSSYRNPLT